MKRALSSLRCGFDVTEATNRRSASILQQLKLLAGACEPADTFLCYFSCHGYIDKATLWLFWDDTKKNNLLASAVSATELRHVLLHCKAHKKLLILDCCYAGAAATIGGKDVEDDASSWVREGDAFSCLFAAGREERAKEDEWFQGSFLTHCICLALDKYSREYDSDGDGRISLTDVHAFAYAQATALNRLPQFSELAIPRLVEDRAGAFYFTLEQPRWIQYKIDVANVGELILLPKRTEGRAVFMARDPVTNAQYHRFCDATGAKEPEGHADNRETLFRPWQEPEFSSPSQPVVCVAPSDIDRYIDWLNFNVLHGAKRPRLRLPFASEWDLCAFGKNNPLGYEFDWSKECSSIIIDETSKAPKAIDDPVLLDNKFGMRGLFGNVWQWCVGTPWTLGDKFIAEPKRWRGLGPRQWYEIRGGSFRNDLRVSRPLASEVILSKGSETRDYDLGFRVSASLPPTALPRDIRAMWDLVV